MTTTLVRRLAGALAALALLVTGALALGRPDGRRPTRCGS